MRLRSLVLSVAGRLNPCAHGPLARRKPDDYTTVSPYLRCYSNALASPSQARPSKSNPETPGDRPLGPVLDFMRLMWAINHGLDRASRGMQAKFGVTGPQRLVLRIVGTFPGLSAGDLARTLHVHPSTVDRNSAAARGAPTPPPAHRSERCATRAARDHGTRKASHRPLGRNRGIGDQAIDVDVDRL